MKLIKTVKNVFSLIKNFRNMKENLKKSPMTTIAGAILALVTVLNQLGIEVPPEWYEYLVGGAAVLLGISGDPDKIAVAKDLLEDVVNEDEKPDVLLSNEEVTNIKKRKRQKVNN